MRPSSKGALLVVLALAACEKTPFGQPAGEPPRAAGAGANEPTGFAALTDEPFNALNENGWYGAQRETTNGSGLSLAGDAMAPESPPNVLQFLYAAGFQGGTEPGVEYYAPPAPVRETYFAFWWKPSNPWQDHPTDVNTIADLFAETTSGIVFIQIDGSNNTVSVVTEFETDNRNLTPNVTATPLVLGAWHHIEWYVKYSTSATSRDGVTRWWLDGVLQGDYRDLQMPGDAGFVEYDFSPTWGGAGGVKTETDFFWIDHAYISVPTGSPPALPPPPPTPPPPPPPNPPPPPPGAWANEPSGFSVMTDEPFNALDENGWRSVQRQTTNGSGLTLGADASAPRSPPSVLQFTYAAGYQGGSEPGVEYYAPAAPVRETYFAFWWKPSKPWQNHPTNVNTIADLFPATSGVLYITLDGSSQTLTVDPGFASDTRNLTANVTATAVTLGAWHLVEWYVKYSTSATSRDGVTRWWLDGVPQGDYRDLQMPDDAGFVEYDFAPTWGGINGVKYETDYFWFDHAHISTP